MYETDWAIGESGAAGPSGNGYGDPAGYSCFAIAGNKEKKLNNPKSMAKKSSIEKNKRRIQMSEKDLNKRSQLKDLIMNKSTPIDERFQAQLKLSKLRRNGARTRVRNRCELTGRPRGYHKRVRLSRIALRDLASKGQIPGMNKSSW